MGLIFLEVAFIFMAIFDEWFTKKKLAMYGLDAELNPLVRGLSQKFGMEVGVNLGIRVPTILWAVLGSLYPMLLAFAVGTRFTLFIFQYQGSRSGNSDSES